MSDPQWKAFVRAQDAISGPPRPALAWARARRTNMKIFADRVEIGDWILPHADVTHAYMYQTSRGIKNRVLEIATPDRTVQINFNPGTTPEGHLPYTIEPKEFPRKLGAFRVVFWAALIGFFIATYFGFL